MIEKIDKNVDVGGRHSYGGKNTFPAFDLVKILHYKIPTIIIKSIPEGIVIEKTPTFKILLKHFNDAYGTNLSGDDLLHSRSSFGAFMDFLHNCILRRYLIIREECEDQYTMSIRNLRKIYSQNLRSVERYEDEIIRTIYRPQGLSKKDQEVRDAMDMFEQAYSLMKIAFKNKKRESDERYFEHLKGVMEIVMRELPNPNLNKIILALLHDVQEDIPEYADVINRIYGEYIARGVSVLSKKDRKEYLTDDEFFEYNNCQERHIKYGLEKEAKNRRNKHYFGHLDNLDDDILDVKLADRIHNLRDISGISKEKACRKITETQKYFLDITKKRNPTAYTLIIDEIEKLKALCNKIK